MIGRRSVAAMAIAAAIGCPALAYSQTVSSRGFVEGVGYAFPQLTENDREHFVGDLLAREEVFVKPADWLRFAAGLDFRANSHDQVEPDWRLDYLDRSILRPKLSVRRLSATISKGGLDVDIGKQFIRWGKADIIHPTDRFAPSDFINVISSELLPVSGVRASFQHQSDTFEGVWIPRLTPSRVPLLDQRWTAVPQAAVGVPIVDAGARFPDGRQLGVRWSHVGAGIEYAFSFFDGFNNLPNIESALTGSSPVLVLLRAYPAIRAYGGEAAVPTRWLTLKGEAEYFTLRSTAAASAVPTDDYILYVVEFERQSGEWVFAGGYAGEIVTEQRQAVAFAPDRGMTKSFVGRAGYTIDPRRALAFESAVHQDGRGLYVKAQYTQAYGQHLRLTLNGVGIAGQDDDFIGQYHRNSHVAVALRYSF
jgi:hypothetical protein